MTNDDDDDTKNNSTTNSQQRIPALKRCHQFHKRNPNDPNRIDDVVLLPFDSSSSNSTSTVIDFQYPNHPRIKDRIERFDNHNHSNHNDDDNLQQAQSSYSRSSFYKGPLYRLVQFPGIIVAPNALHSNLQQQLAFEAVSTYCELPYRTNLHTTNSNSNSQSQQENQSIATKWEQWKEYQRQKMDRERTSSCSNNTERQQCGSYSSPDSTLHSFTNKKPRREDPNVNKNNNNKKKKLIKNTSPPPTLEKLSWATCGLHYDWTERSYHKSNKSPMPRLVGVLSRLFAHTVAANATTTTTMTTKTTSATTSSSPSDTTSTDTTTATAISSSSSSSYVPSASIVNYYHTKSTMGGHRDDLEEDLHKPIVSMSVGLPAIFLLGGLNKNDDVDSDNDNNNAHGTVTAILIRPGDVLIMGGESRLRYHSMARVLPKEAVSKLNDFYRKEMSHKDDDDGVDKDDYIEGIEETNHHQITLDDELLSWLNTNTNGVNNTDKDHHDRHEESVHERSSRIPDDDRQFLTEYLDHHRININVRQVFPDDQWEDFVL